MTVQAHIASLEKKHVALEEELQAILASPSSDDREIADIKRRKLRIKDQMQRLKASTRH
ncbi:YdcH family protein [Rhizobium puerariae]|uniref:YdcH family protein n=1 Tax=Rhizobium puerariae TaxID=1585791 RepID=A0ABV6APE9_9HYPH